MGHPAHPILIVFPFGLLVTGVIFDVVHLINKHPFFPLVAYWMITAGLIGGLLAAVPGWIDWFAIPAGTRAKRIGLLHGLGNVVMLILFAIVWWARTDEPEQQPSILILLVSGFAFALLGLTGWLGGEMIDRLGVGVDDNAHLNAPNSLSGKSTVSKSV